ncbi:reverse transcriptase [Gossypium australe]|uniref:Reverse transcriptase n=1 Tax=Gossypium australe TaxID=47621 RepID=A0A5B6V7D2_9ROSI|nr:reverse transcriptase [Gossypium australe]
MEKLRRKCGFEYGIDVDAEGMRGGLSLGWRDGMNLTLKFFSKSHIDVEVEEGDGKIVWRFTGFYGAFNADWMLNKELEEQIKQGWSMNEKDTLKKLGELGDRLSKWAKKEKGVRERRTKYLNSRMLKLSAEEINNEVLAEMTEIKLKMNLEVDREELFWEQRAQANWLQMGDRNTTFFHRWASYRRKKT